MYWFYHGYVFYLFFCLSSPFEAVKMFGFSISISFIAEKWTYSWCFEGSKVKTSQHFSVFLIIGKKMERVGNCSVIQLLVTISEIVIEYVTTNIVCVQFEFNDKPLLYTKKDTDWKWSASIYYCYTVNIL